MENINLSADYFDHVKISRLSARFGDKAALYPLRLWTWCARLAPDGCLKDYTLQEIEQIMKWDGELGALAQAMLEQCLNILEQKTCKRYTSLPHYHVHDFELMNGHIMAYKQRAITAARARWSKMHKHVTSNAQASKKQCPNPTHSNSKYIKDGAAKQQAVAVFSQHLTQKLNKVLGDRTPFVVKRVQAFVIKYLTESPAEQPTLSAEIDQLPTNMPEVWYVSAIRGMVNRRRGEAEKRLELGAAVPALRQLAEAKPA